MSKEENDNFFDYEDTALMPIDGTDIYYTSEQADNFFEVFGENTDYVVDPEECMADNFALFMYYGLNGSEDLNGVPYETPEIIRGIEQILLGE